MSSRVDVREPALLLSAADVDRLVTCDEAINAVASAMRSQSDARIESATRVGVANHTTLLMAAASPADRAVAGKIVSIVPENRARGLNAVGGIAYWLDYETRRPLLIADASAVTALRTGALSGYATRLLARADSTRLAMIGGGGQALAQVRAMCSVRPIAHVTVATTSLASAHRFADRLRTDATGLEVVATTDVRRAVDGADIVCLATTSAAPLVELLDLTAGAHVNAIGAYRLDMKEVGLSVFSGAEIVVCDELRGALSEAGDLADAVAAGAIAGADLVELGALEVGAWPVRTDGVTLFKSVGSASADLGVLKLLLKRARNDEEVRGFTFS